MKNEMEIRFTARPENERLARMAVAAFLLEADPTMEQIADVKTAVSEAVTNAIIHGYGREDLDNTETDLEERNRSEAADLISMACRLEDGCLYVSITDEGCGIADIKQAMEPLYTSRPELERSGMGFSFMEAFMDRLEVESEVGVGTTVCMMKCLRGEEAG